MKYLIILSTIFVFGLSIIVSAQDKPKDETKVEKKTFEVKGMTCQGCVNSVETKLGKIDGVEKYKVDLDKGEAVVEYNPDKVSSEKIEKEFEKSPYKVTEKESQTGMNKQGE